MGERRRRCAGKVPTADGESDCELPAQDNSIYCHQHPASKQEPRLANQIWLTIHL